MKVLVATRETQGENPGDFYWCMDGELVTEPLITCSRGCSCGCTRSWTGMETRRSTTTALVIERAELTPTRWSEAMLASLQRAGFRSVFSAHEVRTTVKRAADMIADVPVGSIVSINDGQVSVRRVGEKEEK